MTWALENITTDYLSVINLKEDATFSKFAHIQFFGERVELEYEIIELFFKENSTKLKVMKGPYFSTFWPFF